MNNKFDKEYTKWLTTYVATPFHSVLKETWEEAIRVCTEHYESRRCENCTAADILTRTENEGMGEKWVTIFCKAKEMPMLGDDYCKYFEEKE